MQPAGFIMIGKITELRNAIGNDHRVGTGRPPYECHCFD